MHAQRTALGTSSIRVLALAAIVALVSLLVVGGPPARATYPGSGDGRLGFGAEIDGNVDVYTVLPSGVAGQRLTAVPLFDACPAWSADGKMLAWCHGIRAKGGSPTGAPTARRSPTPLAIPATCASWTRTARISTR